MRSVPTQFGATTALGQRGASGGVYASIVRLSALANPVPQLPPRMGYGREDARSDARGRPCRLGMLHGGRDAFLVLY